MKKKKKKKMKKKKKENKKKRQRKEKREKEEEESEETEEIEECLSGKSLYQDSDEKDLLMRIYWPSIYITMWLIQLRKVNGQLMTKLSQIILQKLGNDIATQFKLVRYICRHSWIILSDDLYVKAL